MSIRYTVSEFEPSTFGTRVSSQPLDQSSHHGGFNVCSKVLTLLILDFRTSGQHGQPQRLRHRNSQRPDVDRGRQQDQVVGLANIRSRVDRLVRGARLLQALAATNLLPEINDDGSDALRLCVLLMWT